jgi:hypothetical protein
MTEDPKHIDISVKLIRGQPRVILATTDQMAQPYYRAGMNLELQKFTPQEDIRQLILGEDPETDKSLEIYGLDLTVSEEKALSAIQILLDRTNYEGNLPGDIVQSSSWKYEGYLPKLSMTFTEYYEAYGLAKIRGQYQGRQATEALQALHNLAESRSVCYRRQRRDGKGKKSRLVYDVVRVTKPLISFMEGYYDLEEAEADQIIAGQSLPLKRKTKLVIEVSPLLVDQIDSFYLLKPTALYKEIQALQEGKRPSTINISFINWLLTKNFQIVRINKKSLIERLPPLKKLKERRRTTELEERIQEALQMAKDLGYLLDYREEATGLLILTLNPDRCKRIKPKTEEEEV